MLHLTVFVLRPTARLNGIFSSLNGIFRSLNEISRSLNGISRSLNGMFRNLNGIFRSLNGISRSLNGIFRSLYSLCDSTIISQYTHTEYFFCLSVYNIKHCSLIFVDYLYLYQTTQVGEGNVML